MRKLAALGMALAFAAGACSDSAATATTKPCTPTRIIRSGAPLPDCSFRSASGGVFSLADLRGKPVVLNFWASWCIACIKEMPALQRVHARLGSRLSVVGMDALGVNGEKESFATTFAGARGVTYPIVYDRDALLYANFAGSQRRPVLPLTVFADARGVVRVVNFGELSERDFNDRIEDAFGIS